MKKLLTIFAWIVVTTGMPMLGSGIGLRYANAQDSGSDAERAKNLIVVVSGDLSGDNDVFGAGIIVGEQNDYLYLATANHVVRRGPREATNLRVAFYFMPGSVEATLMDDADEDLDLAMLRVDLGRDRVPLAEVPFDVLGDPSALQRGDGLHAIGHPAGERWLDNITPFPFEQHDGHDLVFQASSITEGHSGGGLFDEYWKLVGMVKSTTGGRAVAVSIDRIQEKLEDWRYPITLRRSGAPVSVTPPDQLAEIQGTGIHNTKIAFHSRRDDNWEIYVMDADGTERRLTNNTAVDEYTAWSPDGRQIAFHSYRDGNGNREIYVMATDGTNQRRLTNNTADDYDPAWSPDGTQIAFHSNRDGNADIYVIDIDGTNERRLTSNTADDSDPTWSPDGTQVAFHSNRDGNFKIYVMAADGENQRRLTYNIGDYSPAWSPDGTQIAFHSNRGRNSDIYVIDIDGKNERRLTNNTAEDQGPAWSPFSQ